MNLTYMECINQHAGIYKKKCLDPMENVLH